MGVNVRRAAEEDVAPFIGEQHTLQIGHLTGLGFRVLGF